MATKYEVELWKEQCRKLTAALDRSIKEKQDLTARIMDNSEEAKTARAVADGLEWQLEELQADNERLLRLVRIMAFCMQDGKDCDECLLNGAQMPIAIGQDSICDGLYELLKEEVAGRWSS